MNVARFWSKVDRSAGPSGCWPWKGSINPNGYGSTYGGRPHRLAYELAVGPIPAGLHLGHVCHDRDLACPAGPCAHRRCCNPAHLRPMTAKENFEAGRSSPSRGERRAAIGRLGFRAMIENAIRRGGPAPKAVT